MSFLVYMTFQRFNTILVSLNLARTGKGRLKKKNETCTLTVKLYPSGTKIQARERERERERESKTYATGKPTSKILLICGEKRLIISGNSILCWSLSVVNERSMGILGQQRWGPGLSVRCSEWLNCGGIWKHPFLFVSEYEFSKRADGNSFLVFKYYNLLVNWSNK